MPTINLDALFKPTAIAHIGASADASKISGRPLRFLLEMGYPGPVYPVNPQYESIHGLKCYPDVEQIPDGTELALISLPAPAAVEAVEKFAQKGGRAVVIISAGFAEAGPEGQELQTRLQEIAARYNLAICGPNCSGLINVGGRVTATFSSGLERGLPLDGPVAMVGQSGALSSNFLAAAKDAGIGFIYWVSTGNEAVCNFNDYLAYFLEDPRTEVVVGYVEDIRQGRQFKEVAKRALELGKPIILLKVGVSQAGARASFSHTGALASADSIYQAVFSQLGVIRAHNLDELFDFARVCTARVRPRGKRAVILTASGGAGVLMSDACEAEGLDLIEVSEEQRERLREALGPIAARVAMHNPIDFPAEVLARPEMLRQACEVFAHDDGVDIIILYAGILPDGGEEKLAREIIQVGANCAKLIVTNWFPTPPAQVLQMLTAARIPYFTEPTRGVKAAARLADYCLLHEEYLARKDRPQPEPAISPEILAEGKSYFAELKKELGGRKQLTEYEGKKLLAKFGFPVPRGGLARTAEEAVSIAEGLGYPVVVKVVSPDIMHKTEASGIRVGLEGPEEVREAFAAITTSARKYKPSADVWGVLVEEMVRDAREVIVGLANDRSFGPVISFGLGGVFVEILRDVAFLPIPFTWDEAQKLLERVKGYPLLAGFRGAERGDTAAIASMMMKLQSMILTLGDEVVELDINPLLVRGAGKGAAVGDCLLVLA